jgi:hypothetical protein
VLGLAAKGRGGGEGGVGGRRERRRRVARAETAVVVMFAIGEVLRRWRRVSRCERRKGDYREDEGRHERVEKQGATHDVTIPFPFRPHRRRIACTNVGGVLEGDMWEGGGGEADAVVEEEVELRMIVGIAGGPVVVIFL